MGNALTSIVEEADFEMEESRRRPEQKKRKTSERQVTPVRNATNTEEPKPTAKPRQDSKKEIQLPKAPAGATVQKTVRFHPTLITMLEDWNEAQERKGAETKSFQKIQNEALKLWLEKNAA